MKTSKNDSAIEWIVKKIGGAIVFKERKKRKFRATEEQAKNQKRFIEAAWYARKQMEDPEKKAMYEKRKGRSTSAYAAALTDYLKAPEVLDIRTSDYYGEAGDVIEIHAKDDFKVVRVRVIIKNNDHDVIEEGEAIESYRDHWEYAAKVANSCLTHTTIKAIAYDYPNNSGKLEKPCENRCHVASTENKKVSKVKSPGRVSKITKSPNHEIIK